MGRSSRFSPEVRERAVRMVEEHREAHASAWAVLQSVAPKLGCTAETLRKWVRQAQRDAGHRPGLTTSERERLQELEREVRELKRANEILRKASAYFAQAELDRFGGRSHDGPVHRRPSRRVRGRADLRRAADRPVDVSSPSAPADPSDAPVRAGAARRSAPRRDSAASMTRTSRSTAPGKSGSQLPSAGRHPGGALHRGALDARDGPRRGRSGPGLDHHDPRR